MAERRIEIHYEGEWAALYVDGRLYDGTIGDSYVAEERAFELLGVKQIHDDAFMRGQSERSGVAQTLEEVAAYAAERDDRRARADRLREQAAALVEEANRLSRGVS